MERMMEIAIVGVTLIDAGAISAKLRGGESPFDPMLPRQHQLVRSRFTGNITDMLDVVFAFYHNLPHQTPEMLAIIAMPELRGFHLLSSPHVALLKLSISQVLSLLHHCRLNDPLHSVCQSLFTLLVQHGFQPYLDTTFERIPLANPQTFILRAK